MSSLSVPASGIAGHRAMAVIEARRMARHPVFVLGVALGFVVLGLYVVLVDDETGVPVVLTLPLLGAFYIGLTSVIAAALLTRSTEVAVEAVATAPGTEARRTLALAAAGIPPFVAGLVFSVALVVAAKVIGVAPQEWWFGTLPDWQVWSIVLMCPVACLDGALLGVLTGRWLRFRGASAVVVVALIVVTPARAGAAPGDRQLRVAALGAVGHLPHRGQRGRHADADRRQPGRLPRLPAGSRRPRRPGGDVARPHRPDAPVPHPRRGRRGGRGGVLRPRGHHRQPRQPGLRPDPVQGRRVEHSALVPPARGRLAAAARGLRCRRSHRGAPRAVAGRRLPARTGAARLLCGRRGVRLRRGRPSGGGRDAARSGLAARQPARRDAGAAVGVGRGGGAATWRRPALRGRAGGCWAAPPSCSSPARRLWPPDDSCRRPARCSRRWWRWPRWRR